MQKILVTVIASAIAVTMLSAFGTLTAFANPAGQGVCANTPSGQTCSSANTTPSGQMTGQKAGPTTTCAPDGSQAPGNSANANGSPFNPNGNAGTKYAGNPGTSSQSHSNSGATVAQYDRACTNNGHT
jgi:hypothetical protein